MSDPGNVPRELVGSLVLGAAENPAVAMLEAAIGHHRLRWRYVNLKVTPKDLGAALCEARAMGIRGINHRLPHTVAVIQRREGLGKSAAMVGQALKSAPGV